MNLRVAAFEPRSLVNGPGVRAVLWVQGCGRRCPGCFNPDFLPRKGGSSVTVADVVSWIVQANQSADGPLEGVTFSGGEPFDQAEALAEVACAVRALGLGVLVFTGNTWAELQASETPGWAELLAASDLLVAGPYEQEKPGHHPLLASGNQELAHLTDRYRAAAGFGKGRRRVEMRIGAGGELRLSGFPAPPLRASVQGSAVCRGLGTLEPGTVNPEP